MAESATDDAETITKKVIGSEQHADELTAEEKELLCKSSNSEESSGNIKVPTKQTLADKQMEPKPLHSERSKEQPKIKLLSNKCESLMKQLEQSQQDLFTAKENHQEEMKEMHEKIEEINSSWEKKLDESKVSSQEDIASVLDRQHRDITSLTSTISEQEQLLSKLIDEAKRKEEQLIVVDKELKSMKLTAAKLQSSNDKFINEAQRLRTQVETANTTVTDLQTRLEAVVVDFETLQREHSSLKEHYFQVVEELTESNNERGALENRVQELEKEVEVFQVTLEDCTRLESQLVKVKAHEKELLQKISFAEDDFDRAQEELKIVKAECSQLNENLKKVSEERNVIAKELDCRTANFESQISEYENTITNKDSSLESLQKVYDELCAEHSSLLDDVTKLKLSLNGLDEENQYCKEIISQLEQVEAERNVQIDELHSSNKNLSRKIEILSADLHDKQTKIDQLKATRKENLESLEHFKNLNIKSHEKCDELQQNLREAALALEDLNKDKEALISENQTLHKKYEIAMESHSSFEEMKAEVCKLTNSNSALRSDISNLQSKVDEVNSKNSSLIEKVINFEQQISTLNDQIESERLKHEEVVQNLAASVNEANDSEDALSSELEILKQSLESSNNEKEKAKKLATTRLNNINNYKQKVEDLVAKLNNIQQVNVSMKSELDKTKNHSILLEQKVKDQKTELSLVVADKDKIASRLGEVEESFAIANKDLEDKENLIAKIENQSKKMEQKLNSRELAQATDEDKKQFRLLTDKFNESEEKKSQLQSQLNEAVEKLFIANNSIENLTEKLEEQKNDSCKTATQLEKENSSLRAALASLQEKIEQEKLGNSSLKNTVTNCEAAFSVSEQPSREKSNYKDSFTADVPNANASKSVLEKEVDTLKLFLKSLIKEKEVSDKLAADRLVHVEDYKRKCQEMIAKLNDLQQSGEDLASPKIEAKKIQIENENSVKSLTEMEITPQQRLLRINEDRTEHESTVLTGKEPKNSSAKLNDSVSAVELHQLDLNQSNKDKEELNNQIFALQRDVECKTIEIDKLMNDIDKFARSLKAAEEKNADDSLQLTSGAERIAEMKHEINALQEVADAKACKITELEKRHSLLAEDLKIAVEQQSLLESDLVQSGKKLSDAKSEISKLLDQKQEVDKRVCELRNECQQFKNQVELLQMDLEYKNQTVTTLQNCTIPKLESELAEKVVAVDQLQQSKAELEQQISNLLVDNQECSDEKSSLLEEITAMFAQQEQLDVDFDASKTYIQALQQTNMCLTEEMQHINEDLAREVKLKKELQSSMSKADAKLCEQIQKMMTLRNDLQKEKDKNHQLNEQIEELSEERDLAKAIINTKQNVVQEKNMCIDALQKELSNAQQALEESEMKVKSTEEECEELHNNMKLIRSTNNENLLKVENLETLYSRLSLDNVILREENQRMISHIETASHTIEELEKQLLGSKEAVKKSFTVQDINGKLLMENEMLTQANTKLQKDIDDMYFELKAKVRKCNKLEKAVGEFVKEKVQLKKENAKIASKMEHIQKKLALNDDLWAERGSELHTLLMDIGIVEKKHKHFKEECLKLQYELEGKNEICTNLKKTLVSVELKFQTVQDSLQKIVTKQNVLSENNAVKDVEIDNMRSKQVQLEEDSKILQMLNDELKESESVHANAVSFLDGEVRLMRNNFIALACECHEKDIICTNLKDTLIFVESKLETMQDLFRKIVMEQDALKLDIANRNNVIEKMRLDQEKLEKCNNQYKNLNNKLQDSEKAHVSAACLLNETIKLKNDEINDLIDECQKKNDICANLKGILIGVESKLDLVQKSLKESVIEQNILKANAVAREAEIDKMQLNQQLLEENSKLLKLSNDELKESKSKLLNATSVLNEEIRVLKIKLIDLTGRAQTVEAVCTDLKGTSKEIAAERDAVKEELQEIVAERDTLEKQLLAVIAERDTLKENVTANEDKLQKMRNNLEQSEESNESLQKLNAELKESERNLANAAKLFNEEVEIMKMKVVDLTAEVQRKNNASIDLRKTLNAVESKLDITQISMQEVVAERDTLKAKLGVKEKEIEKIRHELDQLEKSKKNLQKLNEELKESEMNQANTASLLNEEVRVMKDKLINLAGQCKSFTELLKAKEVDVLSLTEELSASRNVNTDLKRKLDNVEDKLKSSTQQLDRTSAQLYTAKNEIESKNNEITNLCNEINLVQDQLSNAKKNFDIARNQLQQDIVGLKSSLHEKDIQLMSAESNLSGKVVEIEELRGKHSVIVEKFSNELKEKNLKIINLHEESVKLNMELQNALLSLSMADESTSKQNAVIESQKTVVKHLERKLMEAKDVSTSLEGKLQTSTDEKSNLVKKMNDLECIKRKLSGELEQAEANLRSSHDDLASKNRELEEQRKHHHVQLTSSNQREKMLQSEISSYKVIIEELKTKSQSDDRRIEDFSSLVKKLEDAQQNYTDKFQNRFEEVKHQCQLLRTELKEINGSSTKTAELVDELKIEKKNTEQKLKDAEAQWEKCRIEMVLLQDKLKEELAKNNLEEIKCQSLRKEIKELNGSVRRLGELVSELRIQRSNLEQKLKKTDTQLEENRNKMAELRDELKEEQLKSNSEEGKNQILKSELKELNEILKKRAELLEELKIKQNEAEQQLKETEIRLEEKKYEMTSLRDKMKEEQEKTKLEETKSQSLSDEIANLNISFKKTEEMVDELRSQRSNLEEKVKGAEIKLEENKSEMEALREKVKEGEFQNNLEVVRKDCELLGKEMKQLSGSSSKITELLDELRIEKNSAEQKLKIAEIKLEQNKFEMVELQEKLKEEQFKNNLEELRDDCQSLRNEMKELTESSKMMSALVDELRMEKSNIEQKLKDAETRLEDNTFEMIELRDKLKEEQLKNNLEEVRNDCQILRNEMKELNENSKKTAELVDELRIEKSKAEEKLKDAEMQLEENRIELVNLRGQVEEEQFKVAEQEACLALSESISGDEIARLHCDVERLGDSLTVLESQHASELKTLKNSFDTSETEFLTNIDELFNKNKGLQSEVQNMVEHISSLDGEIHALKSAKKEAELELHAIRMGWKRHDYRVGARLTEVMKHFEKLQADIGSSTAEKNQLKERTEALEQELKKLTHLNQRLSLLSPENAQLKSEVETLRERLTQLECINCTTETKETEESSLRSILSLGGDKQAQSSEKVKSDAELDFAQPSVPPSTERTKLRPRMSPSKVLIQLKRRAHKPRSRTGSVPAPLPYP